MYKAKLCSFAIACMIGSVSINPIATFAAETNTESVTRSETNTNQNDKKAAFEKKIKEANDKWMTLTEKQKEEVYVLIQNEMQIQNTLLDKLVELGVMQKEDAVNMKALMLENFNKVKESGAFPLFQQKRSKSSK